MKLPSSVCDHLDNDPRSARNMLRNRINTVKQGNAKKMSLANLEKRCQDNVEKLDKCLNQEKAYFRYLMSFAPRLGFSLPWSTILFTGSAFAFAYLLHTQLR